MHVWGRDLPINMIGLEASDFKALDMGRDVFVDRVPPTRHPLLVGAKESTILNLQRNEGLEGSLKTLENRADKGRQRKNKEGNILRQIIVLKRNTQF